MRERDLGEEVRPLLAERREGEALQRVVPVTSARGTIARLRSDSSPNRSPSTSPPQASYAAHGRVPRSSLRPLTGEGVTMLVLTGYSHTASALRLPRHDRWTGLPG